MHVHMHVSLHVRLCVCLSQSREAASSWGLTQLVTKTGSCPWLPFPEELQGFIALYMNRLLSGYAQAGHQLHGAPIFPSSRGSEYSSQGFREFEIANFASLGLPGATTFNARHAVAEKLTLMGITPTGNSALADSFAAAMGDVSLRISARS